MGTKSLALYTLRKAGHLGHSLGANGNVLTSPNVTCEQVHSQRPNVTKHDLRIEVQLVTVCHERSNVHLLACETRAAIEVAPRFFQRLLTFNSFIIRRLPKTVLGGENETARIV